MISSDSLARYDVPGGRIETQDDLSRSSQRRCPVDPPPSFVRGVTVGLALAIPVWTWIIYLSVR